MGERMTTDEEEDLPDEPVDSEATREDHLAAQWYGLCDTEGRPGV